MFHMLSVILKLSTRWCYNAINVSGVYGFDFIQFFLKIGILLMLCTEDYGQIKLNPLGVYIE